MEFAERKENNNIKDSTESRKTITITITIIVIVNSKPSILHLLQHTHNHPLICCF